MALSQMDVIRRQAEAAVRGQVNRAAAGVRRETSLVGQASQLAGRAVRDGERELRRSLFRRRASRRPETGTVLAAEPPAPAPARDGYVRRSPVQPVCEAADYRRRLVKRAVGVVLVIAAVCAGVYFLSQLGLLGR